MNDYLYKEGVSHILLAAECFSDVRSRNELVGIEKQIIEKLKRDSEYPYRLSEKAAIVLTETVAEIWKGNIEILSWLKQCLNLSDASYLPESAVRAIAKNWKDVPDTLVWLKFHIQNDGNSKVRCDAIRELVNGWKRAPDTLAILKS